MNGLTAECPRRALGSEATASVAHEYAADTQLPKPHRPPQATELRPDAAARHLGLVGTGDSTRTATAEHAALPCAVPGARLVVAHDPYSARSETIRALRTELLLRQDSLDQAYAIALLSPSPGEGRSQLAAELATCFAQLGRRTLLVDADLRRSGQHILFGADNHAGLAQVLAHGETPLLQPVGGLRDMFLLAAGRIPQNPLELLSDGRFECLVDQWRREFEFIIFDTPPLSECADGLAVATIVGSVLTLSRANHTSFRDMREMLRRLAATRAQILGGVISHF